MNNVYFISDNIISPEIISIEDFVQEVSGIRTIDPIELLFEFYEVYLSITDKNNQQSFELFANWAKWKPSVLVEQIYILMKKLKKHNLLILH